MTMSGPALRDPGWHHAIHDAAWLEAAEMTDELRACLEHQRPGRFAVVARALLEHWETRTLRHAAAEEEPEGLYAVAAASDPQAAMATVALRRDHELMRRLVRWLEEQLAEPGAELLVYGAFEALLQVSAWHNGDEERWVDARLAADGEGDT